MKTLFIGTCRVLNPASRLSNIYPDNIDSMRHRTHTPKQALWLLKEFDNGGKNLKGKEHLVSDRAVELLRRGELNRLRRELKRLTHKIRSFDSYIIEFSGLKDFYMSDENSNEFTVNTFTAKSISENKNILEELYKTDELVKLDESTSRVESCSDDEIKQHIHLITRFLPKKNFLFVCNANVDSMAHEFNGLYSSRARLSSLVRWAAKRYNALYFDPTIIVQEIGERKFFSTFADGSIDFGHFSELGEEIVYNFYLKYSLGEIKTQTEIDKYWEEKFKEYKPYNYT